MIPKLLRKVIWNKRIVTIVMVPKRTAPGEPPKRRLCIDYWALNSLLPPCKEGFFQGKRSLTLVPLPKIDEIYARLKGSNIYSTFDMRCGYYHMVLSEESRPKSTFVSSFGKWEFKRCPLDWHKHLCTSRD